VARPTEDVVSKEVDVTITTPAPRNDAVAEETRVESPFLEVTDAPMRSEAVSTAPVGTPESPFLSEYLLGDEVVGGSDGTFRELMAELYDEEFDEALAELVDEADAHAQLLGAGELDSDPARAERALQQWIAPLRAEAETLLGEMANALDASDPRALTEGELDELLDGFEPQEASSGPVFEDFLKKLWKKAKKAVKGAVNLAKKGIAAVGKVLPIGIILRKLKALVRPLLQRVLKIALNKLPPALRPVAAQLARRFLGTREAEVPGALEEEEATDGAPATADVRVVQAELDAQVASLMFAPSEPEQEALVAEASFEAERVDDASLGELDRAREEFVARLSEMEEGEDPTPAVEQFLPAILPALRIGIKVIGRPKVVRFLAKFLGRLIAPYVGKRLTPPLSQAIVDAGLRLMTLEAGEEEMEGEPLVAAEAFAALVEDTATEIAGLDEDELEDEHLVEEAAVEGFRRAAHRHFPPSVLRGGQGVRSQGVWIGMPRRRRLRYRKFSRVFDRTISPNAAAAVRTRGGRTLAAFLKDRLGQTGPVRARVHLYQAVPGTRLGAIARAERAVAGLGPTAVGAQAEFHPLTPEAAAALVGEPELGASIGEAFEDEVGPAAVGQRFYYLEIAGARPTATGPNASPGRTRRPRLSTTTALLDLRRSQLVVAVYLAEAQAQDVSALLRRKAPMGEVLASLRPAYVGTVKSLTSAAGRRRMRVVGETDETQEADAQPAREELIGLGGMPSPQELVAKLLAKWTRRAIARELDRQRDAFVAAAAAPDDGVTLVVTFAAPRGLSTIAQLLRGRIGAALRGIGALRTMLKAAPPSATLEVVAGYRRA
jgi:hypothetical protein